MSTRVRKSVRENIINGGKIIEGFKKKKLCEVKEVK